MRWLIAAVALLAMLATTMLAGPALHSALADSNRFLVAWQWLSP